MSKYPPEPEEDSSFTLASNILKRTGKVSKGLQPARAHQGKRDVPIHCQGPEFWICLFFNTLHRDIDMYWSVAGVEVQLIRHIKGAPDLTVQGMNLGSSRCQ